MKLGKHDVLIEGNLVVCHSRGTLEPQEAADFASLVRQHFAQLPSLYLLLVVHEIGKPPSPETRRLIAQWNQQRPITGAAIVTSSILVRAAVSMVAAAVRAFQSQRTPLAFFGSEEAARQWLATQHQATP